jgi:hypothetical protein
MAEGSENWEWSRFGTMPLLPKERWQCGDSDTMDGTPLLSTDSRAYAAWQ